MPIASHALQLIQAESGAKANFGDIQNIDVSST